MTRDAHHRLLDAGIRISSGDDEPGARSEHARLARVLIQRGTRVIGLVPAADDVAVPAVALQLGRALAEVTGSPVGVIDAYGSWPGTGTLDAPESKDGTLFAATWLLDNVALLTPRSQDIGNMLLQLNAEVRDEAADFAHLVVDLTGFDHLGEHLSVMET